MTGPAVQADAQAVVDWYRGQLTEMTHRAAFAECALATAQQQAGELRGEIGQISLEVEALSAAAPGFDDPGFGGWVAEHWAEIEDARIAHAMEHAAQPAAVEQP